MTTITPLFWKTLRFCKKNSLFLSILFLGLLVRVVLLDKIPNGFHDDEVDAGYIGRYILLHGKDIYGHSLPLFIDKFGDFRPGGIFYLAGFSSLIFGVSEFAVRIFPAICGFLTIPAIYFLTLKLTQNKKTAIYAALFLAILPWHIVLSRATSEAIVGLFFITAGLALLLHIQTYKNKKIIIFPLLLFLLSYFFYHSFRMVVPLLLLPFLLLKGNFKRKNALTVSILFLCGVSLFISVTPWGSGRFNQVAFYNNPSVPLTIERLHVGEGQNNILSARIFHNKAVVYTREFLGQYISYFSPVFLFQEGGYPLRYKIPEQGLLFYTLFPLVLIGAAIFLTKKGSFFSRYYLFYVLIIGVLPAALTYEDSPNVHRSLILIIPFTILAANGLAYISDAFVKRNLVRNVIIGSILFFICIESIYFFHQYITHGPSNRSVVRNDGTKETIQYLVAVKNRYQSIFMPSFYNLPLYYLFYTHNFTLPLNTNFQKENYIQKLGNISFLKTECPSERIDQLLLNQSTNVLFIDNGNCKIPMGSSVIKEILRKDSTVAFRFIIFKR